MISSIDAINDGRDYVKMEWNSSSTRQQPRSDEVPYKFGWGAQFTPDEKPFDFGPDFKTNAKNEIQRYFQHYFFTHFMRDHLSDYFGGGFFYAIDADIGTMMDLTEKMQWFFFFEATDPDFKGSHAEEDMLGATVTGLNLLGKIVGHPANGNYTEVRKQDIFGLLDDDVSQRNEEPSGIALSYSNLGECVARQVEVTGSTVASINPCSADADCMNPQTGNP